MGKSSHIVFSLVLLLFLTGGCTINNKKDINPFEEDECIQACTFSYSDTVFHTAITNNTFNWLFEFENSHYIEKWSGNFQDTIYLTQAGRNMINNMVIPDSTISYLGNNIHILLDQYFQYIKSSNSYLFVPNSLGADAPKNAQLAILYIITSKGIPIIKDDETGFFFIDQCAIK